MKKLMYLSLLVISISMAFRFSAFTEIPNFKPTVNDVLSDYIKYMEYELKMLKGKDQVSADKISASIVEIRNIIKQKDYSIKKNTYSDTTNNILESLLFYYNGATDYSYPAASYAISPPPIINFESPDPVLSDRIKSYSDRTCENLYRGGYNLRMAYLRLVEKHGFQKLSEFNKNNLFEINLIYFINQMSDTKFLDMVSGEDLLIFIKVINDFQNHIKKNDPNKAQSPQLITSSYIMNVLSESKKRILKSNSEAVLNSSNIISNVLINIIDNDLSVKVKKLLNSKDPILIEQLLNQINALMISKDAYTTLTPSQHVFPSAKISLADSNSDIVRFFDENLYSNSVKKIIDNKSQCSDTNFISLYDNIKLTSLDYPISNRICNNLNSYLESKLSEIKSIINK